MKLTNAQLKQIIKEELRSVLNEGWPEKKAAMFTRTLRAADFGNWPLFMQGLDNIYNLTITKKGTAKDEINVWEFIGNKKLEEMSEKIDQFINLQDQVHGDFDWDKVYRVKEFLNYYLGQGESWI